MGRDRKTIRVAVESGVPMFWLDAATVVRSFEFCERGEPA